MVSIIVPVYKTKDFLHQCVRSILAQTYPYLEIILVDDGSPDACPLICDEYSRQDSRITVIHKENGGLSSSREAGIAVATGAYVLVVDSDDWIEPETVEVCVQAALHDNADCVLFSYVKEYQNKSIPCPLFESNFGYDEELSEMFVHRRIVGIKGSELRHPERIDSYSTVWGKLYRLSTAKEGRIISERLVGTSEDAIFNLYALDHCRISYINQCFYHYRKFNSQSITAQHKPDLADKWDVLYATFLEYIAQSAHKAEYQSVFLNRVACGMIGLGLNEISSNADIGQKSQRLKAILSKPLYMEAFSQFDTSYCSIKWKLFFLLCKRNAALPLALLLQIMNYLRSRVSC